MQAASPPDSPAPSRPPAGILPVLLAFVCFALGALLVAPPLLTAQNESLREEIDEVIEPASDAVTDFRLRVSLEATASLAFLIAQDTSLLHPLFNARERAEANLALLDTLAHRLSHEAITARDHLAQAHAAWIEPNLELVAGRLTPETYASQSHARQQARFQDVFAAAADLNSVLRQARIMREAQIRRTERVRDVATLILGILALGAAAVTLGLGYRLRRYASALQAREAALRDLNATLEQRVDARTAEVRRLTFEVAQAEFREQRRVAHVLHDHLQQLLVAARLRLHVAPRGRSSGRPDVARVEALLTEAIDVTRSLSVELAPPVLRQGGVAEALRWLGAHFEEAYNLVVDVVIEAAPGDTPDAAEEPGDVAVLLFQIARELLFNVVKHGKTNWAGLSLTADAGLLVLTVEDEGAGFDPEVIQQRREGFGLGSIRERINLIGGTFEVESQPGEGTRVAARIPHTVYASPRDQERPGSPS